MESRWLDAPLEGLLAGHFGRPNRDPSQFCLWKWEPQKEVKQVVMPKCVKRLNHETIITAKGLQCQGFTYCSAVTNESFHPSGSEFYLQNYWNSKANDFLVLVRRSCYYVEDDSALLQHANEIKTKITFTILSLILNGKYFFRILIPHIFF